MSFEQKVSSDESAFKFSFYDTRYKYMFGRNAHASLVVATPVTNTCSDEYVCKVSSDGIYYKHTVGLNLNESLVLPTRVTM